MKKVTLRGILSTILILALVSMAGLYVARDLGFTKTDEGEFGQKVRAYLLQNPQVIREAIEVLTANEQRNKANQSASALSAAQKDLEEDGYSYVAGNPNGDVTIVEFFDYRCGYCKRSFPDLMKTVEEDGNVRLVLKEFPILGEQSVLAAQAVMASQLQGKYEPFHKVLMQARGGLTMDRINEYATQVGIDTARLAVDMKSDEIRINIRKTYNLANTLGITGTPAFIIGGQLAPGAIPAQRMRMMIAEARSKKTSSVTN
ncbi:MAG: DsbA family protein [Sneathiella sp.]|nr:DsbA family protein [Sneathiella sp.]